MPKVRWQECPACQSRMRTENLEDEAALQSWFIRRIGDWLHARGRQLVGWDEILEGGVDGLNSHAVIMSWRVSISDILAAWHRLFGRKLTIHSMLYGVRVPVDALAVSNIHIVTTLRPLDVTYTRCYAHQAAARRASPAVCGRHGLGIKSSWHLRNTAVRLPCCCCMSDRCQC